MGAYRAAYPGAAPGEILAAIETDWWCRIPALRLADAHTPARLRHLHVRVRVAQRSGVGACHALEIGFVFDTLDLGPNQMLGPMLAGAPQALADAMHGAWVAFATTGDPGWARYDLDRRATMRFDAVCRVVDDPRAFERGLRTRPGVSSGSAATQMRGPPGRVLTHRQRECMSGDILAGVFGVGSPHSSMRVIGEPAAIPVGRILTRGSPPSGGTAPRPTLFAGQRHGPSTSSASSSPGQGGIAVQVKTRGTSPVHRYWNAVPSGTSTHTPGMSGVMLSRPSAALRQISPSPESTNQYSSTVRKRQARPTIPGGTVEWIMLPCGPSTRKRM